MSACSRHILQSCHSSALFANCIAGFWAALRARHAALHTSYSTHIAFGTHCGSFNSRGVSPTG
ncbi:hypothetical protein CJ186_06655 [Actinomyces graevenitzii]|nr:hypothetical protein CJ186_06655 [Actinomyces graevenitzii]